MFQCGCISISVSLKQVGETWQSDCKECVCDKDSMSVKCEPIICPLPEPIICTGEGEVLMNHTHDCCNEQACGECLNESKMPLIQHLLFLTSFIIRPCPPVCDKTRCLLPPVCSLGFVLKRNNSNDSCCPFYHCGKFWHTLFFFWHSKKDCFYTTKRGYFVFFCHIVPKGVCVFNNTEYMVGITVSMEINLLSNMTEIALLSYCSLVWSSTNTRANNVSALILWTPAQIRMPSNAPQCRVIKIVQRYFCSSFWLQLLIQQMIGCLHHGNVMVS